jgi:D-alanyl-D-alanine carboxypeptidase/D-alanyl-D-alanine-endopeptidase (penicillin-binding protein 4)
MNMSVSSRQLKTFAALALAVVFISSAMAQSPARKPAPAASARPGVAAFRARVEKILAAPEAARGYWGILVEDADTGEILYSLNGDHYFLPASNAKLFTAALALSTMGPDFRFHTTIETRDTLDADGVLHGDLVLVGRGDPGLSNRKVPFATKTERDGAPEKMLAELADAVVARGVKQISGDVVGDDSYFTGGAYPSGWAIDDMLWNYGVPVSALEINDGTLFIDLTPGETVGAPANYTAAPWAGIYQIRNEVVTGARGSEQKLSVDRDPGSTEIFLRGTMPLGAPRHSLGLAIDRPAEYAAALLKDLLEARGVKIYGRARANHVPVGPAACCAAVTAPIVLAEHISLPFSEALRVMAKTSQNLHAEMFLRVAAKIKTSDPTADAALQFEEDFLKSVGLDDTEIFMTDASGLSRRDLVAPKAETTLLRWAARQPWAETFRAALPVAGVDGTLSDRMLGTLAAGKISGKTGSINHVDTLAGYATTSKGAHLIFSFMGNNHTLKGRAATAVLDSLAIAMVEEISPARRAPVPRKK